MHNRVRMIVASFLVKNLRTDWRKGRHGSGIPLLTRILPTTSASWQWVADVGPMQLPISGYSIRWLQTEKFDPEGDYIRRYVPELVNLQNSIWPSHGKPPEGGP